MTNCHLFMYLFSILTSHTNALVKCLFETYWLFTIVEFSEFIIHHESKSLCRKLFTPNLSLSLACLFIILNNVFWIVFSSVQSLSHVRLCDPMNCSTPGLPVHHQLLEFTQTHAHWVGDAIQPSHPLLSLLLLPPIPPSIRIFSNESTSHEVAKVLEFQL